jgi:two-component system chemotaxis response regulator CheY
MRSARDLRSRKAAKARARPRENGSFLAAALSVYTERNRRQRNNRNWVCAQLEARALEESFFEPRRLKVMAEYSCLIVEDSPMMRQLLVFALSRIPNLRVTEADDGVDGLRKLASARYDIILTDINMPIMDGLKLVKRVRSDPAHKDTPIIIITTEGSQEDRQRALQLGANAYIMKPIQAPQVIATVKELLKIE